MQYKGLKRMKRVAAVILSAAIMVTDIQGVSAAEYGQASETEVLEKETSENEAVASETADSEEAKQSLKTETSPSETGTESSTDVEQETGDLAWETETVQIEITEDQTGETETRTTESETTETETAAIEETETETEITEVIEARTEQPESVPVPEVDDSVYEFESVDYTYIDNAVLFTTNNVTGGLEKNEQGEYSIENKDQLITFLASETDYSGSTVKLNCDVDMKGEAVQLAKTFEGIFDGNGHSIYNFTAEGGLFREIGSDGQVKNLHLSDVVFSQNAASAALAVTNNGIISSVSVSADITVTSATTATAGIVLKNAGTISDCVFAGSITAGSDVDDAGKAIGGIVSSNTGTVENCHALGSINTNAAEIGGIAASNYGTIKSCTNHMSIVGAYSIGGITAENTRTVSGCENYGEITQKNSSLEGLTGGIAAKNTDTISDCNNYAGVTGAYKNISGIAGSSSGTITNCGNYASISGAENVGGIVGLFNGTGDGNIIENSFNMGRIGAVSNSSSKNQGIGGILGAASTNAKVSIENCYNTAGIQGAVDTKYLGGIVGVLYSGSLKSCYSIGTISAAAATESFQPYAAMIAGFMGAEGDADCTGCLFLEGDSDTLYYRESGAVAAADEKKTADALKGSDGLSVLGDGFMADESGINDGYPVIKGQSAAAYQYIIMYELNGGCADYYFETAESGNSISEPAVPTKKNASFTGWYKDKAQSQAYSFSSGITKSAVIYAGWETRVTVEDITLSQTEVTLIKSETFNLKSKVVFEPEGAENTALTFSSSDEAVATVDDAGVVTAVSEGTATISIKMADGSLDKELTFTVTVSDSENVVRFKIYGDESAAEITSTTISMGDPVTVQAVFGKEPPETAKIQWTSSKTDYVTVTERADLAGRYAATLEGLKSTADLDNNYVEIICTLIYEDRTTFIGTLKVTVKPLAESIAVKAGNADATGKEVIYDIDKNQFIAVGDTILSEPTDTLSAVISPRTANQEVKWSSSNNKVIKFDDEDSGKAEAGAIGEATVTATAADGSGVTGRTTVRTRRIVQKLSFTPKTTDGSTITPNEEGLIEIAEGTSIRLEPTYVPADATIRQIKWTNGNQNALTIKADETTNILTVTAKEVAYNTVVTLTATATDKGGASCEVSFIIKPKVEKVKIYRTDAPNDCVNDKNIGIDPAKDSMTFKLMAVNEPDDASQNVTWKIDNTKVAELTDNEDGTCTVVAKTKGTAVITATAADGSGTKAITTLNVSSLAAAVVIEGSSMVMKGKTVKLTATVYPKSATNKSVKWESLTPVYATVNESTGVVKGLSVGYALIKATAADGSGISSTYRIDITDTVESFDIMIPDGDDDYKNDELLTGKTIGLDPDEGADTYTVAARILPKEACQEVEWVSSNEKIATVENGVITAKALGTATIKAKAIDGSGKTASVKVNITKLVKSIKITGGHYVGAEQELQLKAEVGDKDAKNKSVIWKSSNEAVATVDGSGLVTAEGTDGKTIITAEAADGSGIKAEHVVYVVNKKNKVTISGYDAAYPVQTDKNSNQYIDNIDLADQEVLAIRVRAELSGGSQPRDGVPMDIKWSTSNKNIATVEPDEYDSSIGVITVYKAGKVKITAKSTEGYGTSGYVTLTVENTNPYVKITGTGHRLAKGKKLQLSAGSVVVDWSSSDEQIATVNSKGQVTADKNAAGEVTITAKAVEGTHFDEYKITVGDPVKAVDVTISTENVSDQVVTGEKLGVDLMKGYDNSNEIRLGALLDDVASSDVTWKTSNKKIATIDEDGNVEILKNGNVTFTATATDGSKKKGKVTFMVTKQITSMTPVVETVDVGLKKTVQLSVDYRPLSSTSKKATWESSNPEVASVGKSNGKVKGVSEGVAIITATATDGSGQSCSFTVCVEPAVNKVEVVKAGSYEYQDVVGIDLSSSVDTVALDVNLFTKEGKEYVEIGSQRVSWSSSNKNIAEVDENGVVTAHKNGEVTITATALDGSKKKGKVKIYAGNLIKELTPSDNIKNGISLNLRVKKTLALEDEIKITPITATNQNFVYTSSDKKIVTVNTKGKVTAKKAGEAEITVTPKDGSGIILKIPVTVTK